MKIFISVDMEGMAGITSPSQEREETVSFRRALHNQVRWIIEGIQASEKMERLRRSPLPIPMEAEETFPMMN